MQPTWNIHLFGGLRVRRGDDEFFRFSTRKAGTLLAFLAFHADRSHTRETLCDLLWPDEPPQTARARLRVALTSLRRQLEPPGVPAGSVIRSDGNEWVALAGAAVTTDVVEVERALETLADTAAGEDAWLAAGRTLVARYREPLLPGFYEDWVIAERERLCQATVEQLSALAHRVAPDAGLEFARHAAHLDPLSEEPLHALLPLMAANGQPGAARRTYEAFRRRLDAELGMEPSPELAALAAALPEGRDEPAPKPATPTPVVLLPSEPEMPPAPRRLPTYPTRFFGREAERRALRLALDETPLVTLTGPGGVGKTRLAVETTRAWDGAGVFVPLDAVTSPERIPDAICGALGDKAAKKKGEGREDTPEALLGRAADLLAEMASPLLVLDNLEQVADGAGSLLLTLLGKVPALRLLVTSRLRLHLPGEREFPLPPLPVPPEEDSPDTSLEETASVASVGLFLDRARAARPDFQITARNNRDVATVCRMLDGLPLAIELVAAWGGSLAPAQMRERLADQGSLQISDRRAAPDFRHRSLYAAIDWSYKLLPPDLRTFFARLSVFRGGFTAAAAAAVCYDDAPSSAADDPSETDEDAREAAASEALARLRAHSLVAHLDDSVEMRYTLLESLRSFGEEQIDAAEREAAAERHAAWCADLAEGFDTADSEGDDLGGWLERIDAEMPNIRAALEHDLERNPVRAVQTAGGLWDYWQVRGRPTEGRAWLERALAAAPVPPEPQEPGAAEPEEVVTLLRQRARAAHGAGTLAGMQGADAAGAYYEECLRLFRRAGDRRGVGLALNNLGLFALSHHRWDEARAWFTEGLEVRREVGVPADLAGSLLNLAVVDWEVSDFAAALPRSREALELFRRGADRLGEARALNNLGGIAYAMGDPEAGLAWYEQSLAVKRELGFAPGIAMTLANVGVAAMYQGHYAEAAAYLEEALESYRQIDAPQEIAHRLRNLAQVETYQGNWDRAYALLVESLEIAQACDTPDDQAGTLEAFAILAGARGDAAAVAPLLGAADRIRRELDGPLHPSESVAVDKAAADARAALGDAAYEDAFAEGAALPPEEVLRMAVARGKPGGS